MTITVTGEALSIEELLAVVDGAPLELGSEARAKIEASHAVIEAALAGREAIYGLTTQVGHGKDELLTEEQLGRQQRMLVVTHSGGLGAPLPTRVVRAALVARVNGIARGGSGASMAAADVLVAMVNAGVHPLVPETASVGAGDIGQMAGMAQVAIGMGRAEYRGEALPGSEALARAGIAPLELEAKDGLALISANAVSIGHGALVVGDAARVAEAADLSAALSLEATGSNLSIIEPAVAEAKPFPGQIATASHLREVLSGSYLHGPDGARSVQDALSFRVVPQVHGALREFIAFCRRAVEIELNSTSDNPLVSIEERAVFSNGNFQPVVLAVAFDALRVAIAHVGQLSERRLSHLWDAIFGQLAAAPVSEPEPQALFGLQLRYPAAAAFSELKQLAAPATLDTPPLDMSVEDHGTAAPLGVRKSERALELLEDLLAVERMLSRDLLSMLASRPVLGAGTSAALREVEDAIATSEPYPEDVHRALRAQTSGSG
ncbi:MAG: aromatic amino acid lyase [Actinobacteria bacterium]|nr:aromatic amino acid lyase [Actinomycetota bacterium]